jgi:hypothetical protein
MASTLSKVNTDIKWMDEIHSPDADDGTEPVCNEASEDLTEVNPVEFSEPPGPFNMSVSTAALAPGRGYTKLPYDGTDVQFEMMDPTDGGFLGRPQGWER